MDWDYVLSVSPENLSDDDKDQLYNMVTWFNTDGEDLDVDKCTSFIKISQEVLKYKGEQVEVLLHKLDELATQRGEEEADTDGRSSKSKKSTSMEFENLEERYLDLKAKYKKQLKSNERKTSEINKLKQKIGNLEQDKNHLVNEMQLLQQQDDAQSDVSESFREQHKELLGMLHGKNKQISDLLRDIEDSEKENIALREKLTDVRDELSTATKDIVRLNEDLKASKIELDEASETVKKLSADNDGLQDELGDVLEQKRNLEREMEEFTEEVNLRVDEWKRILDDKDREIQELKSRQPPSSLHSSLSSLPLDNKDQSRITTLNKLLSERERQLLEVKTKLQESIAEMDKATTTITMLSAEKDSSQQKISELSTATDELKKKLNLAHERCHKLQDDLSQAEKLVERKQREWKEVINRIREGGNSELADLLDQVQILNGKDHAQEKQIMDLVKTTNELQERCDDYERENDFLREKCGIPLDEPIIAPPSGKRKHQKKEPPQKKQPEERLDEEMLELKSKIHKLNQTISALSKQLIDLGQKPNVGEPPQSGAPSKEDVTALIEENEALRKGMHEILDSLNTKKESSLNEVKSETFEKLLRALDVKHISGWYHPAMRLQAELHNLEGINAELREQLRLVRLQLQQKSKDSARPVPDDFMPQLDTNESNVLGDIRNNLHHLVSKLEAEFETSDQIEAKLLTFKDNFSQIRHQIRLLYEEHLNETQQLKDKLAEERNKLEQVEEQNEIQAEQLKLVDLPVDSLAAKVADLSKDNVVLKRKCTYLDNEVTKLTSQVGKLQQCFVAARTTYMNKIQLLIKNQELAPEHDIPSTLNDENSDNMRHNLDSLTIKYRQLLHDYRQITNSKELEIKMLQQRLKDLELEKNELKVKVGELLDKVHCLANVDEQVDNRVEALSKKLSQSEVNEISEKQRANHTNNLYELVKEQLQKLEERCAQFEAQNEDISQRNLILQEQLTESEARLVDYVSSATFATLQSRYNDLAAHNDRLKSTLSDLKNTLQPDDSPVLWDASLEAELLALKHQIVDLQALTDDKALIARLSNELSHVRAQEIDSRNKVQSLVQQLQDCQTQRDSYCLKYDNKVEESAQREQDLTNKINLLKTIVERQKLQYLGCIPLTCEEKFIDNVRHIVHEKHKAFLESYNAQIAASDVGVLKEKLEGEMRTLETMLAQKSPNSDSLKELFGGLHDKKLLVLNELKLKRQIVLKDNQLQHVFDRLKSQDEHIIKLEEELFNVHKFAISSDLDLDVEPVSLPKLDSAPLDFKSPDSAVKLTKSKESQTIETSQDPATPEDDRLANLHAQLLAQSDELSTTEQLVQQLKNKIMEHEMNISLFRKQLGDKQSQITFYERHILELQNKKDNVNGPAEDNTVLKSSIADLQEAIKDREDEILRYQSLLKEDRDKHSLAASLMRDELQMLQKSLMEERQRSASLQASAKEAHPSKAALEQYFIQVHSLEDELSELRTKVSSLESQLQASRQEAVRWRTLANDRLESMQKLGENLEELHHNEISVYKNESDKWRDEVNSLKQMITKYRQDSGNDFDLHKMVKDKDNKIHELTVMLRQAKSEAKKAADKPDFDTIAKINELQATKDELAQELDQVRKRFDQLLAREKSAREEIRDLRGKLVKKPITSARSDKSDRSIKDQLQKKITTLENEIVELKDNLTKQTAINESHRVTISEDFERWNKQKHWQQTSDKLKDKLKSKDRDLEKLQETCAGYRILIERLERDKYGLENKIRTMKSGNLRGKHDELDVLREENMKLISENEELLSRLEMQHHHAGGLGAAMLQEKLEAQERKIAVLELCAKGTVEVRAELERLQNAVSNSQKSNLRLEAENLDLKLDLENSTKEVPHLRDQILHLENYIEVLKNENVQKDNTEVVADPRENPKKISELERTIFVLKRVVEKLQAENKRLSSGKKRFPESSAISQNKLHRDYQLLKEKHYDNLHKIERLEQELNSVKMGKELANNDDLIKLRNELADVRQQLAQKTELLSKVKFLLQRAAVKEKSLLQKLADLQALDHSGLRST